METNFNNLPLQIDVLLTEVRMLKKSLVRTVENGESETYYLNLTDAIMFMEKNGFSMSKSRIYKLTSSTSADLPVRRFGKRLMFHRDELKEWCFNQIKKPVLNDSTVLNIARSARKQYKNALKH